MVGALLSLFAGTFKEWMLSRHELEKKRLEAKAENIRKGIPGISDEYLLLVWTTPFIAVFIPPLQPIVINAFQLIDNLPDWYVGGFISLTFAVFGIDKLFKWRGP